MVTRPRTASSVRLKISKPSSTEQVDPRSSTARPPARSLLAAEGPHWMHYTVQVVADSIPNASRRTLEGQTHDVAAKAIAPVLVGFFAT